MDSLPQKPLVCPLCQIQWNAKSSREGIGFTNFYRCPNYQKCKMTYIESFNNFFLRKTFRNKIDLWWVSNDTCYIKDRRDREKDMYDFEQINFVPPFDISQKRFKLLMLLA